MWDVETTPASRNGRRGGMLLDLFDEQYASSTRPQH